jgi:uncharacterized protein
VLDVALTLLAGILTGAVMGTLGAGGSLLTVPVLVILLGLTPGQASATSLVAVALMAVSGLAVHRASGRCSCRAGFQFAAAGVVTAFVVSRLATGLPDSVLAFAMAAVLVATVVWVLRRDTHEVEPGRTRPLGLVVAAGAGVGVLTGLLGVGGGFVIVPALMALLGLPASVAVGTSSLVILTNVLAGLAGRLGAGQVLWTTGLVYGAGGVVGAAAGARLAGRLPEAVLRRAFATLATLAAVVLVVDQVA